MIIDQPADLRYAELTEGDDGEALALLAVEARQTLAHVVAAARAGRARDRLAAPAVAALVHFAHARAARVCRLPASAHPAATAVRVVRGARRARHRELLLAQLPCTPIWFTNTYPYSIIIIY